MVSGLVTSPEDQSRICLDDANPMRMASNSLMSINSYRSLLHVSQVPRRFPSLLNLYVCQVLGQRARLCFCLFLRVLLGRNLDVLLAHLDLLALVGEDVHVERQ